MWNWNSTSGVGSVTHRHCPGHPSWVQGFDGAQGSETNRRSQSPQTLLDLLHLSSCCGCVCLPTGAQLLSAALCARHPSSVPSGLRTCKHSLKCDTCPLYQQCPINTTCVHAYIGPADTPSHEVNTSLCLCSGQEKVSFKKRTQNFTK